MKFEEPTMEIIEVNAKDITTDLSSGGDKDGYKPVQSVSSWV